VLLNDSLRVNFDQVISGGEVLVVKGALGAMGAGNTSVLMQLLIGMLDAALARRQDGVSAERRTAVALKVDEAPLVLNRGFAETMALKRSAGLETVACWQTDSQWIDRDVRAQLDGLFAHRVYFATASVSDARDAASLTMAEFSDMVRPGIRNLSDLGHPDVRLHLPRHSAIVSWVTPEGRQAPFIAHTMPLRVDDQRLALHAARQAERGGRYREDLSQPHWERESALVASPHSKRAGLDLKESMASPAARAAQLPQADLQPVAESLASTGRASAEARAPVSSKEDPMTAGTLSSTVAESYRELVEIRSAHSVRWAKVAAVVVALEPEPLDIEILGLLASMRHLLSSQIHRRFNEGRAATTTQRRLKRLADAGLVARFQFHRRDGGGVPMCYSITPAGLGLCAEHDGSAVRCRLDEESHLDDPVPTRVSPRKGDRLLRQAYQDVRAAGWAFAVERALTDSSIALSGPMDSVITPPSRSKSGERRLLRLSDLCLPGGRTPHDFLHTVAAGSRVELERFQSVRPAVTIVSKNGRELLVELDDRLPGGAGVAKLERYDHFLAGWSTQLRRYTRPGTELPLVVFVCRDRERARECARQADHVLTACRAYAGEYPSAWEYVGRERVIFASERDAHERLLYAWGVPRLPPEVRVTAADGDPRRRDPRIEFRKIDLG
jgi:predicted transcriptional regulator